MTDMPGKKSEVWKGVRRGAGWTLGVGTVVSAGRLLREGPRESVKALMKVSLSARDSAAELSEQLRDVYAEAQAERTAQSSGAGE